MKKTSILNARKSLANDIEKMIESIGIDAAIRSIERELKPRQHIIRPPEFDQTRNTPGITIAGDPDSYYIDLEELELLAERLLGSNRIQEAFEVLKIGIKVYPTDFRAYSNLAEAYAENGETELARVNYYKAMGMNPRRTARERRAYETAQEFVTKNNDR
ncbi:tetratricopeptide repeat protein [candidate division KSB1 bacterium]